jgi:hypothetical protein
MLFLLVINTKFFKSSLQYFYTYNAVEILFLLYFLCAFFHENFNRSQIRGGNFVFLQFLQ